MSNPPSGTVTFLFTDIEGSTKHWEQHPRQMQAALQRHNLILSQAIEKHGGHVFKTMGDAYCAAFGIAHDALRAAIQAQQLLHDEEWVEVLGPVTVRMALHTGAAEEWADDYFGPPVNRVARLLSAGHGGQILLSLATQELVRDGLPPGVELRDLGERRLKDLFRPEHIFQVTTPGLPTEFAPLKTLDARFNNLPVQPTPLIGRERELQAASSLLRERGVRLVTLTGPGGTGKTRLALQLGAEMLDEYEDGVIFINLAPITDYNLIISEIAQTFGVKESAGRPLIDSLKDYLQEKRLLLILDNFEQLVEGAPTVSHLLATAPQLQVIVTSRTKLGLRGEHEYGVPPLQLPDLQKLPVLEKLTQYEAVRLFIERARAARADFEVTNDNAPAVAEICHRLDGLPLAIELAAARIKLLPPQAMLSRLESRLKILTGGSRDLPVRQQTLRNAIEWSYDLLSEDEKRLFMRLAVFVGGRTLEAIEAICNADNDTSAGSVQALNLNIDVLDGVQSLLDKSLLRQEEGVGGESRFVMLETIHEYAREKLEESGEAEDMQRKHTDYFAAFAQQAALHLRGPQQAEWLLRLDEEHDNLRAALRRSLSQPLPELAATLASSLERFWMGRGYFSEARRWLEEVLTHRAEIPKPLLGITLRAAANQAMQVSESRGEQLLLESIETFRELGDKRGTAMSLNNLGNMLRFSDTDRAQALLEESLRLHEEIGTKDAASSRPLVTVPQAVGEF